jgi:hypothetical protein
LAISIKLEVKDVGFSFSVLNVYGPYANKIPFWKDLANVGALSGPLTLVGGDLNFTLSFKEVWGENTSGLAKWFFLIFYGKASSGGY